MKPTTILSLVEAALLALVVLVVYTWLKGGGPGSWLKGLLGGAAGAAGGAASAAWNSIEGPGALEGNQPLPPTTQAPGNDPIDYPGSKPVDYPPNSYGSTSNDPIQDWINSWWPSWLNWLPGAGGNRPPAPPTPPSSGTGGGSRPLAV